MDWLLPRFGGRLTIQPLPEDFALLIGRRVESGLLAPGHRARDDYEISSRNRSGITFVARGLPTSYDIGLNEVTVDRAGANEIRYQVSYWGWTRIALVQGLLLGAVLAAALALDPSIRRDVADVRPGVTLILGMAAFWSLIWPGLMSALHKPHAERVLRRVLGETLGALPTADAGEVPADARRAS